MATLNVRSFTALVQAQAAAIQARASVLVDFTIGSILRSVVESNAGVGLWLQGLVLQVLLLTRAATSKGADLDTWVQDFGMTRLAAAASAGQVTFARFSTGISSLIPVGAQVQTADGTQNFTVIADSTKPAYSAAQNGYVLPIGVSSLAVPVKANTPSAASNVQAGSVTVMRTAISGVDTVTNASAMSGGGDAEADAALRTRFVAYLLSLSKGTKQAVCYAVTSVQAGLSYTLTENYDYAGNMRTGYFYVVVDDGSGAPAASIINAVYTAVDAVRPLGVMFAVFAPTTLTAEVAATVTTGQGYDHNAVVAQVGVALTAYINGLGLGARLDFYRLAAVIYGVSGVTDVTGLSLNGGTSDLIATTQQVIKPGAVTVS
ncbi:hypothetical protein GCM10007036_14560 [Alsobacter metallidurans]|uniref:Baseplate protein n=1 Tax=Alsobacter metallidurans TaxID=340221 RepID=A0A917I5I3_9HYPH|nr:baseplate J/gp47 family protein [Alsobacter metallidurans]GGH14922.1 hypothetical protein GCM10007036_14560 [Alsobacter metallidurans]